MMTMLLLMMMIIIIMLMMLMMMLMFMRERERASYSNVARKGYFSSAHQLIHEGNMSEIFSS